MDVCHALRDIDQSLQVEPLAEHFEESDEEERRRSDDEEEIATNEVVNLNQ